MPTELIWTALPTGRSGSRLHLSAHVTPRLTSTAAAPTLADFPLVAAWPPSHLTFDVLVDGGAQRFRATTTSPPPDPTLWPLLFPPTTTVTPFQHVDRSNVPIHTYPVAKVAAWLRDRYAQVAIDSGEELPAIDDLLGAGWDDIRFSGRDGRERWESQRAVLDGVLATQRAVDTEAASSAQFDFFQLEDFFAPSDLTDPQVRKSLEEGVAETPADFHFVVQALNEHSPLLRLLGLVYDLDVDDPAGAVTAGAHTVEVVGVHEGISFNQATHRRPRTHCEVSATDFRARPGPAGAHLADGYLRFEDTAMFEAVRVDTDGGGLKAGDRANDLQRNRLHRSRDTPDDAALPSLRADGIAVARIAQAKGLHARLVAATALQTDVQADAAELWAEDLVRGLRVDVLDVGEGRWFSLMERTGGYELDGGNVVLPVADEGFVVTNAGRKPGSGDLFASEELFLWDGWSLVAPRPGRVLNTDPTDPDPLLDRSNEPRPEFDARIEFQATPGTLPRLRYGRDYRLRARTVDLAGNSLPAGHADATHATPVVRFGRLEPVQTPPVLLRTPRGPGESMETVVLRSNHDSPPSPASAQRHVVPPKVGQVLAELHGVLDVRDPGDPTTSVLDKAAYEELVSRDAATLADHDAATTDPDDEDARYYDTDEVEVTWTPDPAITAVALKLLDGPSAGHLALASLFPPESLQQWPGHTAVRLVVTESTTVEAPSFDIATGVLTVPLRKADVVHARLSGVLDTGRLDEHTLWDWVLGALPSGSQGAAKQALVEQVVGDGQHWMFEPFRRLTLVHATRQPLLRPEFPLPPAATRPAGATFAELSGTIAFSRRSTGQVDVIADWEDPVDEGPDSDQDPAFVGDPGSRRVERQVAVVLPIEHGDALPETEVHLRHRHELGDTRHHVVTYRAVATSRFTEFFTTRDTITYDGPGSVVVLDTGTPPEGVVEGSVKLSHTPAGDEPVTLVEGDADDVQDYVVDPAEGSITFGDGSTGRLPDSAGATLRATYLVPPFTRETSDAPGPGKGEFGPRTISVPSSTRPAAPRVEYAVPAFRWETDDVTDHDELVSRTSTRHGRLLRVFLDRPWWSSGVGELLGVVTWPAAEASLQPELGEEDPLRPYVTQWGEDPIFDQRPLSPRHPRLSTFPRAVATDTGLTLGELGGSGTATVNVAGHDVGFDPDRRLWYADVEVGSGDAYVPFVRLALARWQPDSIPFQELSPVVLADFVQLAPDRAATVVFDDADRSILGVTLVGPTHLGTLRSPGHPGSAQVIVEQRRNDFGGDLAWQQLGQPVPMTGTIVDGIGQWSTEVHLDEPVVPGTLRLVVEQFERLAEEPDTISGTPGLFPGVQPTTPVDRLVFTDVIPL